MKCFMKIALSALLFSGTATSLASPASAAVSVGVGLGYYGPSASNEEGPFSCGVRCSGEFDFCVTSYGNFTSTIIE